MFAFQGSSSSKKKLGVNHWQKISSIGQNIAPITVHRGNVRSFPSSATFSPSTRSRRDLDTRSTTAAVSTPLWAISPRQIVYRWRTEDDDKRDARRSWSCREGQSRRTLAHATVRARPKRTPRPGGMRRGASRDQGCNRQPRCASLLSFKARSSAIKKGRSKAAFQMTALSADRDCRSGPGLAKPDVAKPRETEQHHRPCRGFRDGGGC